MFRRHRELWEAVWELQERLYEADPDVQSAGYGCCGCGRPMADVVTPPSDGAPRGEGYCRRCVRRRRITVYVALPGRETRM
jgi:hypothetical protein